MGIGRGVEKEIEAEVKVEGLLKPEGETSVTEDIELAIRGNSESAFS